MTSAISNTHRRPHFEIEVADASLLFRTVQLDDQSPTGQQIATAAGLTPNQDAVILQLLANGELEDIRPSEIVQLGNEAVRFIVVESDRTYRLFVDGVRFDWPCQVVSGATLRKLGAVPAEHDLFFERREVADELVEPSALINLNAPGSERFYSKRQQWQLNVQNVLLNIEVPTITVREALLRANFDITLDWQIFLKIADQPKQAVNLDTVIDLRTPGIEKLRLMQREINNGEASLSARREFALLEADELFLDAAKLHWETSTDGGRRWLLISNYPIPAGYMIKHATVAVEIPPTYPGAQLDMFYCNPPLALQTGASIPATEVHESIHGASYQRWSRHRGASSVWNPLTDSLKTHLAIVDAALLKEVGQ